MGRGTGETLQMAAIVSSSVSRRPRTVTPKFISLNIASIPSITSIDYHYIDIDYDEERNCDEAGCDTICRCRRIFNTRVSESSGPWDIAYVVLNAYQTSSLDKWVLDRKNQGITRLPNKMPQVETTVLDKAGVEWLIRESGISPDSFEVDIEGGYYGQEIGSVDMSFSEATDDLDNKIQEYLGLPQDPKTRLLWLYEHSTEETPPVLLDEDSVVAVENLSDDSLLGEGKNKSLGFPSYRGEDYFKEGVYSHMVAYNDRLNWDAPVVVAQEITKRGKTSYNVLEGKERIQAMVSQPSRIITLAEIPTWVIRK